MKITNENAVEILVPLIKDKIKVEKFEFYFDDFEFVKKNALDIFFYENEFYTHMAIFPLKEKDYTVKELKKLIDEAYENKERLFK